MGPFFPLLLRPFPGLKKQIIYMCNNGRMTHMWMTRIVLHCGMRHMWILLLSMDVEFSIMLCWQRQNVSVCASNQTCHWFLFLEQGYPWTFEQLANHINQPKLVELVHLFLHEQLHSCLNSDCGGPIISVPDCLTITLPVSVFHSAIITFYAPSDLVLEVCTLSGSEQLPIGERHIGAMTLS